MTLHRIWKLALYQSCLILLEIFNSSLEYKGLCQNFGYQEWDTKRVAPCKQGRLQWDFRNFANYQYKSQSWLKEQKNSQPWHKGAENLERNNCLIWALVNVLGHLHLSKSIEELLSSPSFTNAKKHRRGCTSTYTHIELTLSSATHNTGRALKAHKLMR